MIRKMSAGLILLVLFGSCYNDREDLLYPSITDCNTLNAEYAADIAPIIQSSCAIPGCHDAASGNKGGPFTNFTQVKNKAAIIKAQVVSGAMPQGLSLSQEQIKLISCWVDSGAPNN